MKRTLVNGLLGAAAGIVMVSDAQAADMPVKAKAIEYVKICSAYGAGFYYIPGTDICLRVGGYVFLETGVKGRNAAVDVLYNGDRWDSSDNYMQWRARGHVILDARQNTAYGTLRAYFVGGVSYANTSPGPIQAPAGANTGPSMDRAFIEFAGFTAGFTESFFSFGGAYSIVASPSLSWDWLPLIAYTAQLGNGVTATVSIQDGAAMRSIMAGTGITAYGGDNAPDVVGNIRVTQAWGSAQIMGALHELRMSATSVTDTAWGYAVGAGIEIKTPQTGNPNNSFLLQGVWSQGAVEYTGLAASPVTTVGTVGFVTGASGAIAFIFDAVGVGSTLHKTEAWSAYAAYRHYWTPALRTGFAAGITDIGYDAAVNALGGAANDARIVQGTVSTIWSPVAGLDLSLDLVYSNVKTSGCPAASISCPGEEDIWTAWTRIRRNF
jgi:hypothetical protein